MKQSIVSFVAVVALVLVPRLDAQTGRGPGRAALAEQVRVALGRGQVTEARQLVESAPATPDGELARALVHIFEGRDDAARKTLEPLAKANPLGDAAVELGLLDIRHGRRDEGWKTLEPIVSNRNFAGEDDYFRLARAARASLEILPRQRRLQADRRVQAPGRAYRVGRLVDAEQPGRRGAHEL